ncbi:MAG: hypothetical protein H0W24_09030, partial [Lysobacter sp.]|nr:hypothetical protein [Lysobacter sp.]
LASAARGVLPGSEPKDPNSPLRGITKGFGFGQTLAQGILSGRSAVEGAMATVAQAMVPSDIPAFGAMMPGGVSAGAGFAGAGFAASGETASVIHTHVYLDGREIAHAVDPHLARSLRLAGARPSALPD